MDIYKNNINNEIVYTDYLHDSHLYYLIISSINLNNFSTSYNNIIKDGKIIFDVENNKKIQYILNDNNLFYFVKDGMFSSTQIPFTLCIYKKYNEIFNNINSFTSISSSYLLNNGSNNINIIKNIFISKIGFDYNHYNFYDKDYYLDYYLTKNFFSSFCIKIVAQKIFLWNIIYRLSLEYNINIDFVFYHTFYTCFFENLKGLNPMLSNDVNIYFNKYKENFIPSYYDSIIEYWINMINNEEDLIKILIYQQSSFILAIDKLKLFDINILYEYINYENTKTKLYKCYTNLYDNITISNNIEYYIPIHKNVDFLNNWELVSNLGCSNKGLYVNNNKVLISRKNFYLKYFTEIENILKFYNRKQIFPKLHNIYEINKIYYLESEKLDGDVLSIFNKLIPDKIIDLLNYGAYKKQILKIFSIKNNNRANKINSLFLKLYIFQQKNTKILNDLKHIFNTDINEYTLIIDNININIKREDYNKLNNEFKKIGDYINFFNDNVLDYNIYHNFINHLLFFYKNEYSNVIKKIGILELKLINLGYFCNDWHKLENFGYKFLNGKNDFYIIDWEKLEKINNNDIYIYLKKIVNILNQTKINNDSKFFKEVFSNFYLYNITDQDLIDIGINENLFKIFQEEHEFISNEVFNSSSNENVYELYENIVNYIDYLCI